MSLVLKGTITEKQALPVMAEPVEIRPRDLSAFAESEMIAARRTGGRPLHFKGNEIMTATSHSPGPSLWYEIYVWRNTAGGFVMQVRFFGKTETTKDRFRVFEAESFAELAEMLESYDTQQDIDADIPVDDASVPVAVIALRAAELRMKLEEARRQFADLTGEVLHALDVH